MALRSFSIRCQGCRYRRNAMVTRFSHMVMKAISEGLIQPIATQTCADCGEKAAIYDHRDYNKPLEVEPVCVRCNTLRGPAKQPSNRRFLQKWR